MNLDEEELEIIPILGDFGASKNWEEKNPSAQTVVELRSEPWTPSHEGLELTFQHTWDVYAWGVIAISCIVDELPKTYKEIENTKVTFIGRC